MILGHKNVPVALQLMTYHDNKKSLFSPIDYKHIINGISVYALPHGLEKAATQKGGGICLFNQCKRHPGEDYPLRTPIKALMVQVTQGNKMSLMTRRQPIYRTIHSFTNNSMFTDMSPQATSPVSPQ